MFDGDNYADEWHAEAERSAGWRICVSNSSGTALPWLIEPSTVEVFSK